VLRAGGSGPAGGVDEALIARAGSGDDIEPADRRPDAAYPQLPLARCCGSRSACSNSVPQRVCGTGQQSHEALASATGHVVISRRGATE